MDDIDVSALKEKWTDFEFDEIHFEPKIHEMIDFAASCGETDSRYLDADHADFQAAPTFTTKFHGRRSLPEGFPVEMGSSFDAGKSVEIHEPLRAGDSVTGTSMIHDIYEKTGRSGSMLFVVHRMKFTRADGELVSIVDWRLVQKRGVAGERGGES